MRAAIFALCLATAACDKEADSAPVVRSDGGDGCAALKHLLPPAAVHLATCSDEACGNAENPPTGGDHCSTVLACKAHPTEQPRCQWLHNMEHGHLVLLYNCPEGCADLVAELDGLRGEAKKGGNAVARALVTPDTKIPTRAAALLWGWSWTGDTVDADAIRCLLQKQDEEAPEPGLGCAP